MPALPTFTVQIKASTQQLKRAVNDVQRLSTTFKQVSTDFKVLNQEFKSALRTSTAEAKKNIESFKKAQAKLASETAKSLQKITTAAIKEANRFGNAMQTQINKVGNAYSKLRKDVQITQNEIKAAGRQISSTAAKMGKDTAAFGKKMTDAFDRIEKQLNEVVAAIKKMSNAAVTSSNAAQTAIKALGKTQQQTSRSNKQQLKDEMKVYRQYQAAIASVLTGPKTGQTSIADLRMRRQLFGQMLTMARQQGQIRIGQRTDPVTGQVTPQRTPMPIGIVDKTSITQMQAGQQVTYGMLSNMDATKLRMGQLRQPMMNLGTHIATIGKNAQWTGRQLMMGLTMPVVLAIRKTRDLFLSISSEYTRMEKVLGTKAFQKVSQDVDRSVRDLVRTFGANPRAAAGLMGDMVTMGYSLDKTLKGGKSQAEVMAKEIMYTSTLGDVGVRVAKDFYRTMMKVFVESQAGVIGFSNQIKGTNFIIDQLNQIENKTSINLNQLAESMPTAAGAAKLFGLSAAELASILTGLYDKGITNVMTGATSLNFILTRILAPTEKANRVFNNAFGGGALENIQKTGSGIDRLFMLTEKYNELLATQGKVAATQVFSELVQKRQIKTFEPLVSSITEGVRQIRAAIETENLGDKFREKGVDPVKASFSELKKVIIDKDIRNTLLQSGVVTEGFARAMLASAGAVDVSIESLKNLNISLDDLAKEFRDMSVQEIEVKIKSPEVAYQVLLNSFRLVGAEIGRALFPSLLKLMRAILSLTDYLNRMSPKMKTFIGGIAIAAASLGPLVYLVGTFTTAAGLLTRSLAVLLPGLKLLNAEQVLALASVNQLPARLAAWGNQYVALSEKGNILTRLLTRMNILKGSQIALTNQQIAANAGLVASQTAVNTAMGAAPAAGAAGAAGAAAAGAAAAPAGNVAGTAAVVAAPAALRTGGAAMRYLMQRKELFTRRAGAGIADITPAGGGYVGGIVAQMQKYGVAPPATTRTTLPLGTRIMRGLGLRRYGAAGDTVDVAARRALTIKNPYSSLGGAATGTGKNLFTAAAAPLLPLIAVFKFATKGMIGGLTALTAKLYQVAFKTPMNLAPDLTGRKKLGAALGQFGTGIKTSLVNSKARISSGVSAFVSSMRQSFRLRTGGQGLGSLIFGPAARGAAAGFPNGGALGALKGLFSLQTLKGILTGGKGLAAGAATGGAQAITGAGTAGAGLLSGAAGIGAIAGALALALPLIIAIIVFVKKLMENWDQVSEAFQSGIKAIKDAWGTLMKTFKDIGKIFSDAFKDVDSVTQEGTKTRNIWQTIGEAIGGVMKIVAVVLKFIAVVIKKMAPIFRWFADIMKNQMNMFINIFKAIGALFGEGSFGDKIKNFLYYLGQAFAGFAHMVVSYMRPIFVLMDLIKNAFLKTIMFMLNVADRMLPDWSMFDFIKQAKQTVQAASKIRTEDMMSNLIDRAFKKRPTVEADVEVNNVKVKTITRESDVTRKPEEDSQGGLTDADKAGAGNAAKSIYDSFLSALKAKLQEFISDLKDLVFKSFEEVWSKRLKVFDDQIAAIDELEKKEEELLATQQYVENRREALNKRTLDRQNYVRNRALAIYEGRIDDARMMDLEFSQTDAGNTKAITDLDSARARELLKKSREVMKKRIQDEKAAAEERKKIEEEALKKQIDLITEYTPKTDAEWNNMMNSINTTLSTYGIPLITGTWTDGLGIFKSAIDETLQDIVQDAFWAGEWVDDSIYRWIAALSGVPFEALVKRNAEMGAAAGEAYGTAFTQSAADSTEIDPATGLPKPEKITMKQGKATGAKPYDPAKVPEYLQMLKDFAAGGYKPEAFAELKKNKDFMNWLKGAGQGIESVSKVTAEDGTVTKVGTVYRSVIKNMNKIIDAMPIDPNTPFAPPAGPLGPRSGGIFGMSRGANRYNTQIQRAYSGSGRRQALLSAIKDPILGAAGAGMEIGEAATLRQRYLNFKKNAKREGKPFDINTFLQEEKKKYRLPKPPKGWRYDKNGVLTLKDGYVAQYDEQGNIIGYDKMSLTPQRPKGKPGAGGTTTTTTQPKPSTTTGAPKPTTTTTTPPKPTIGRRVAMGMMRAVAQGITPRPGAAHDFSDIKAGDDIADGFFPDGGSAWLGKGGKWLRKRPSEVEEIRGRRAGRERGGVGVRKPYPTNTPPIIKPRRITDKEVKDALQTPRSLRGAKDAGEQHGKNFTGGIGQGIRNNVNLLNNPLTSTITYMNNTTGDAMDARSPSRKAMKFGKFWVQGIIKGLKDEDTVEALKRAINALINPLLNQTKRAKLTLNWDIDGGGLKDKIQALINAALGSGFTLTRNPFDAMNQYLRKFWEAMLQAARWFDRSLGFKPVRGDQKGEQEQAIFRLPPIPLAMGGIVKRRSGGILAQIGEGRYDEAVIPLPNGLKGFANSFQPAATSMRQFEGSMQQAMVSALKECAPYMNGGDSGGVTIYVDNFIGQPQWFESMMTEYGVKVAPNKQRSYGTMNRRITSYQDNSYRTGRI